MNRYACYFENNKGCLVLNAKYDEEVAWLAEAHARMEGTKVTDVQCLDRHHYTPEIPDLYEEL